MGIRPFLKWAGNKYAIIDRIARLLPPGNRLIEPFAGSAAVFLNTDYPRALIADSNPDLIGLYRTLQDEGDGFIAEARELFTPAGNDEERYYALRAEFNANPGRRRKSALFLYLNRHGYNGLCRYNAKGVFNVPFGRYAKPYFPEKEMRAFQAKARTAEFRVGDFRAIMSAARPGDVVYCDPPYVPLSSTANFTGYHSQGFAEPEQADLVRLAEALAARGVTVVISNHDTEFTVAAYHKASLRHFDVRRSISCNGKNRTRAKELLALFAAA